MSACSAGGFDVPVDTVLVALDPMPDVIAEAKEAGAQCIVTHHPLFFDAPNAINARQLCRPLPFWSWQKRTSPRSTCIRISTVCPGGVNDALAETLGLTDVSRSESRRERTHRAGPTACIRTGMVREQTSCRICRVCKVGTRLPRTPVCGRGEPRAARGRRRRKLRRRD